MSPESKATRRKRRDGSLIARGPSKWLIRYYTGLAPNGRRRYASQIVHGSRKDAQSALSIVIKGIADGTYKQPSDLTLGKFLDRWLETVCSVKVRETTLRGYQGQINNLSNLIKAIKVKDLRADHLQDHYASVTTSTARHLHAVIRAAMRYAVKTGILERNPCEHIELPRHYAREIQFLSEADASKLLAVQTVNRTEDGKTVTVSNRYRVLFAFLLATGCRPSEAFGLQWSDVDLEKGTASIRRALHWHSRKQGGGYYLAPTKTRASERIIPLPSGLLRQLREHRAKQAEALLKRGIRSPLVFTTSAGTPILRRNLLKRYFKPALVAAGLSSDLTLYCLRHSCASLLLTRGIHPKVVSERLGHGSVTITLDTYSHVLPSLQLEATAQLDVALFG